MSNEPGFNDRSVSVAKRHAPPPKKKAHDAKGNGQGATPQDQLPTPKGGIPQKEIGKIMKGRPGIPEVYYNSSAKDYWMKDARGIFRPYSERALRRELVGLGFNPKPGDFDLLSEVDEIIREVDRTKCPSYIGPLAGHSVGMIEYQGKLVLATESPQIIKPAQGDWSLIRRLTEQMFKHNGIDQTPYVYGWLKFALECIYSKICHPGQVLAMAGPRKCGKSFYQTEIITPLLGGRSERPNRSMRGESSFNSELFRAEHLILEDEVASTDIRARRHFGSMCKQIASNHSHSCHGKYREALELAPLWRLSISLNDETENLMVLPIIDDSLEDKMLLLLANKAPMPMPTNTAAEKERFAQAIRKQLPAFAHFLTNWKAPNELRSTDYGIAHFHHPTLLASIQALSPEAQMWSLIIEIILREAEEWEGTATQIQDWLQNESLAARKLFTWPTACGTFLGRLEAEFPKLVCQRRGPKGTATLWTLRRPA